MLSPKRLARLARTLRAQRSRPSRSRPGCARAASAFPWRLVSSFGAVLACALCALALSGAAALAHAQEEEGRATLTILVDGYEEPLPVLVEGDDFTLGAPVQANPLFLTDPAGGYPLAALTEEQERAGRTLVWHDQNGGAFDWFATPVTGSMTVTGSFVEAAYEVRVAFDDDRTPDLIVAVKQGQSFHQAHGAPLPTPDKIGHTFVRWENAANGEAFDFDAPVSASTTVRATYRIVRPDLVAVTDPTADVPQTLTGTCYIGATWSVHPAQFNVSGFTGGLKGFSGTGWCSLPSAAAPSNTTATYTATLSHIDLESGEVVYDVQITPPGAASPDGPRNSLGLIGYQTVAIQATVKKNFGGYVEVSKASANPALSDGNAQYSYAGGIFGVYNQQDACVARLETRADGSSTRSPLLPAGTYTIKEETAPAGYATCDDQTITVVAGQVRTATFIDAPHNGLVDLVLQKVDRETARPLPLGAGSLAAAQFRVDYYDRTPSRELGAGNDGAGKDESPGGADAAGIEPVLTRDWSPEEEGWGDPVRSWVFATDEAGSLSFDEAHLVSGDEFYRDTAGAITLPLGTVTVREVAAPPGYLANPEIAVRVITGAGVTEHVGAWASCAFPDQVKRGDLSFTKVAGTSMERLANVPFALTSHTTGETHTLVTDANGMANTAASWVPHSRNTNAGTSADDGIWFGIDAEGTTAPVDDALGALPYDTYTVEELPCAANEGLRLVSFTVTIERDAVVLDVGTVDDERLSRTISGEVDKRQVLMDDDGVISYTIDYRSTSDTWVDEFNLVDEIDCAAEGKAYLTELITPVCFEDYDGRMNVWYRTDRDDANAAGNEAGGAKTASSDTAAAESDGMAAVEGGTAQTAPNACATNPPSKANPANERVHDFSGWRIWATDVSTLEATTLTVADLGLAEDEHVIAFAFEHGRVEAGFGTNAPDASAWERRDRYEPLDMTEAPFAHEATFDTADAVGPTASTAATCAYAPAIAVVHVTEETRADAGSELWNTASVDLHRDLELHDDDRDAVVQATSPEKTIADIAASKLPKTEDVLAAAPTATALAALLAALGAAAAQGRKTLRRMKLRHAVRKGW